MAQHKDLELMARPHVSSRLDSTFSTSSHETLAHYDAIPGTMATPVHRTPKTHPYETTVSLLRSPQPHCLTQRPLGPTWWQRMGYLGLATLVVGTLTILASCSVLIYLWQGAKASQNRNEPEFWRTIIFRGWATRLVTICSAAIRVSIAFQIGLLIAALAALVLETGSARFPDLAILSIERALGSSPFEILPATFRQSAKSGLSSVYCLIITIACAIALASTFTSTILLSDFGTIRIAAPNVQNITAVGLDTSDLKIESFASYMRSRPMAHWRFAEMNASEPISALGDVDTGDVYRAQLPFADAESRSSLEYYSGPAMVTNFRTVCVSPDLSEVKFNVSSDSSLYLSGKFEFTMGERRWGPRGFECKTHREWDSANLDDWPVSFCTVSAGFPNGFEPGDELFGLPYLFDWMLLLNASAILNGIARYEFLQQPGLTFLQSQNLTMQKEGPWTKAALSNGTEVISASMCFINKREAQLYNVTMSGGPSASEPIVDWRRFVDTENDGRILQQLGIGVERNNFEQRGIMELAVQSESINYTDVYYDDRNWGLNGLVIAALDGDESEGWSMMHSNMTWNLATFGQWKAHPAHTAIFQAIIQETRNPATAMHALVFSIYQMVYYDWQLLFNVRHSVTTVNSTQEFLPVQWTGLIVALCLVFVHIVIVFTTTALYALHTKVSLLGDAWQSVAQIVSPETEEMMKQAPNGVTDKDVKEWAKSTGLDVGGFRVGVSVGGERIEVQRRP